ncbi:MAG: ABC transporter permease subunit [Candidatus Aminicenantes bacterium]|nr:ABC transporter permease subunit [Candidatus Aminicenantes bacterium]
MLSQIIKKEIRDHMVSLRFIILFALCVVLIPLSFYINYQSYKMSASNYNNLVNIYQSKFESAKEADRGYPEPAGFRPPSPTSVFALGYSDVIPISFTATETGLTWGDSPIVRQPILPLFGNLDFLFIVKIVLSLLAFLMTFDVVAGEKEKGTLKIALSNPVPRHKVILGKSIGGYLTILAALLISVLIGMVIVSFLSFPLFSGEVLSRFLLILLVSFLYLALMLTLGLFVSSRCHSSLSSLTILLLVWVVLILAFPSLSGIAARIVYPVKSEQVLNQEKAELRSNIRREKGKELSEALQRAGLLSVRLTRRGEDYEKFKKLREPIASKYEKREAELIRQLEADYQRGHSTQDRIAVNISRLSPASTLTYIMSDLCHTGLQERENFYQEAKVYYQQLDDIYYSKMWMETISLENGFRFGLGSRDEDRAERKDLPFFTYKSRGLGAVLSRSVIDIGVLVLYTVIFFLGAYFSFLRYDVR